MVAVLILRITLESDQLGTDLEIRTLFCILEIFTGCGCKVLLEGRIKRGLGLEAHFFSNPFKRHGTLAGKQFGGSHHSVFIDVCAKALANIRIEKLGEHMGLYVDVFGKLFEFEYWVQVEPIILHCGIKFSCNVFTKLGT